MSLKTTLLDRIVRRKVDADDWVIAAGLEPREKRQLIAEQVRNSVLPRKVRLHGENFLLSLDAGDRKVHWAEVRTDDSVAANFSFSAADTAETTAVFAEALNVIVESDAALEMEFLPLATDFPNKSGAPADIILKEVPKSAADVKAGTAAALASHEAAEDEPEAAPERAAKDEPVAAPKEVKKTKKKRAKESPPQIDKAEDEAQAAPFDFVDAARAQADHIMFYSPNGASSYPNREQTDEQLSASGAGIFLAYHQEVSEHLGDQLLCVMTNSDANGVPGTMVAVAVDGEACASVATRPNRLGAILRIWQQQSKP